MNISSAEANALLEAWRDARTPLRIRLAGKEFEATIDEISGPMVKLNTNSESVEIDVYGVDFNGDARPKGSNQGAYLICEFRNGDRCSFYADRKSA